MIKTGKIIICPICLKEKYRHPSQIKNNYKFCSKKCYAKYVKINNLMRGEKNPAWKGGRIKNGGGYIKILLPNHHRSEKSGYVGEHVVIMEKKIGRKLKTEEIIHHINKIKDDNRIENLYLCKDESEHQRIHAGWIKKNNTWFKKCKKCKKLLKVSDDNFYKKNDKSKKLESFMVYCKKCCQKMKKKEKININTTIKPEIFNIDRIALC